MVDMNALLAAIKVATAPHYPHVLHVSAQTTEEWDSTAVEEWIRVLNGFSEVEFIGIGQKTIVWENNDDSLEIRFTNSKDAVEFKMRFL